MSIYIPRYTDLLRKAGLVPDELPGKLRVLVTAYDRAINGLSEADAGTQKRLLYIVVQADAVIAAAIHALYSDRLPEAQVDKAKLLALKAKALRLKLERDDND